MDTPKGNSSDGEVVELPLHCTQCGGALAVQCVGWQSADPLMDQSFVCPYCRRHNDLALPARLVWVSRRVGVSETPTRH